MNYLHSLAFALFAVAANTTNAFSQTTTTTLQTDTLNILSIKVKGISCSNDVHIIVANVKKLVGVNSCEVGKQGTTTTFEVRYNPSIVTEKELYAIIEASGSCKNPDERPYKVKQ